MNTLNGLLLQTSHTEIWLQIDGVCNTGMRGERFKLLFKYVCFFVCIGVFLQLSSTRPIILLI